MPVVGAPPVRYPSGVSTSAPGFALGRYPFRTPARLNEYWNDFNTYAAADWTVTAVGGGTSALTSVTGNGGKLLLTTGGTAADIQGNELTTTGYAFTAGSAVWYQINVELGHASNSAFMAGLSNTFAALTPTAGVYFSKPAGAAVMNAVIRAASVSTTITIGTVVAATPYTFSFFYDGRPTPSLYFFSTIGQDAPNAQSVPYFNGGSAIAGLASSATGATNTLANLPATTTLLTAGFALKANTVAAHTATIDYMLAAEEIVARF